MRYAGHNQKTTAVHKVPGLGAPWIVSMDVPPLLDRLSWWFVSS